MFFVDIKYIYHTDEAMSREFSYDIRLAAVMDGPYVIKAFNRLNADFSYTFQQWRKSKRAVGILNCFFHLKSVSKTDFKMSCGMGECVTNLMDFPWGSGLYPPQSRRYGKYSLGLL